MSILKDRLSEIIKNNSNYEVNVFSKYTNIIQRFASISNDMQLTVERILLVESNFENIDKDCLPLKMFRDLLLTISFDTGRLFKDDAYIWLTTCLLHARNLTSLTSFVHLKKQIVIFVETEVIPEIVMIGSSGRIDYLLTIIK